MTTRRKLIVTGANGFVAGSVLTQAGEEWEVHAVSRGESLLRRDQLSWHTFDTESPEALTRLFLEVKPDALIHTAAMADIDFCQTHRESAYAVNVGLTRTLVDLCRATGAKLVFCSTDTVFDGEHAPYGEDAQPGPINFYAETKVAAEQAVACLGAQAVIARLSLVIGLPVLGAGNSFLARMIASFTDGRAVAVPEHEVRTPVDVITAGRALLELAAGRHHGIFHLAGHDRLSRFAMAQRIAARFGFAKELVLAQAVATAAGRAARPRDVALRNAKAGAELETPMRTLDEGLSLILKMSETPVL